MPCAGLGPGRVPGSVFATPHEYLIMRSPIYWHRGIYRNTYGRLHPDFEDRYRLVVNQIEPGTSVLDLCCGDGRLYTHYLRWSGCRYTGTDLSLTMAPRGLRNLLIKGSSSNRELPVSDYVVMMESLYHFYREAEEILKRMRSAARRRVIILEQVENRITRLPRWLNHLLSNPGNGSGDFRFQSSGLREAVRRVDPEARVTPVFGGYDLLILMAGSAGSGDDRG